MSVNGKYIYTPLAVTLDSGIDLISFRAIAFRCPAHPRLCMLGLSRPFRAYPSMHTAVLPSFLLSMRIYTSWTPTAEKYAFQSSFRCPLDGI